MPTSRPSVAAIRLSGPEPDARVDGASGDDDGDGAVVPERDDRPASPLAPYGLLAAALDDLAAVGALAPQRRPSAEFSAWSAVHGLAMLLVTGPLQRLDEAHVRRAVDHLLDVVDRGLTA